MDTAWRLRRALTIGLTAAALMLGGTLVHPVPTASAAVLPDTQTGAPDIGYPNCGSCRVQFEPVTPLPSGGVGYPGCPSGCHVQGEAGVSLPASGDVGYPGCPNCRVQSEPGAPAPSGDVGYPGCPSSCRVEAQPADDAAEGFALV